MKFQATNLKTNSNVFVTAEEVDASNGNLQINYTVRHLINHEKKVILERELGNYDNREWEVKPVVEKRAVSPLAVVRICDSKGVVREKAIWSGGEFRGVLITKSGHLLEKE